ncbi:RraA family protein [Glutamicibacter mishrai]|uniref:Putative 4-hydroxy-4-methyl-2-oxoglutarate aldolase n=1 Tax=Glutamicibacter mishrai TaxID=1775880 RepID=A0A6H0SL35_9MICC|nr:methyltransferase [Glutamicibacter mishrai]QIV87271.1 methyltransferase [Glutamicibacter mishrai]
MNQSTQPLLVAQSVIDRLAALPAANIGDAMQRLGIASAQIQAVWEGAKISGPAYTVWVAPGDNAGIHEALKHVQPGEVIVVNGGGYTDRALLGELIGERAISKGVAGFAVDGAVRDAVDLGEINLPVFARATSPAGPYKNGPFEVNGTIAFGGVAVSPGDIVIGDSDGLVIIPAERAEDIATAAEAVNLDESQRRTAILASRKLSHS